MDDKAHVVFVDPHAKSDGRHNDLNIVPDKLVLPFGANVCRQSCMVGQGQKPLALQHLRDGLRPFPRQAVNDARFTFPLLQKLQQLLIFVVASDRGVVDFWAVKAVLKNRILFQSELLTDVLLRHGIGCGCERQERHFGQCLPQFDQPGICWAEVMSPRTDAMRFIDGNQRNGE